MVNVSLAQQKEKKEKIPYLERDSLYRIHSPRKALLLSAALPGGGQIYNKKTWKAPIVWAGMGTCVGFIIYNSKIYNELKHDYIALNDGDPTTNSTSDVPIASLQTEMERFHKYREISFIALAGVYALNMLDAYVDGYLYHYDINENLSAGINPIGQFSYRGNNQPGYFGLSVTLSIK